MSQPVNWKQSPESMQEQILRHMTTLSSFLLNQQTRRGTPRFAPTNREEFLDGVKCQVEVAEAAAKLVTSMTGGKKPGRPPKQPDADSQTQPQKPSSKSFAVGKPVSPT